MSFTLSFFFIILFYRYTHGFTLFIEFFIFCYIFVGTRFVADRNGVGFACEKALTISFVERGFERLGLDRQATGFSWRSYKVK